MYDFIIKTRTMVDAGELAKKLYESPENSITFDILDYTDEYLQGIAGISLYMYLIIYDKNDPGRGIRAFFHNDFINVEFKFMSGQNEIPVLHAVIAALLDLTGEKQIKHCTRKGSEMITLRKFKSIFTNEWYDNKFKPTCESALNFVASNRPDYEFYAFTSEGLKKVDKN